MQFRRFHIDKRWIAFLVFALTILLKEVFFNWRLFHNVPLLPQWSALDEYAILWLGKMVAPLLLASFVFLFKRIWWSVCINCIIDIWCIANAAFYRSYSSLLTWDVIGQANNLQGFENSIWMYLQADMLFYPLTTIVCGVACWKIKKSKTRKIETSRSQFLRSWFFVIIASLLCSMTSKYLYSLQVREGLDGTNMSEEKKREQQYTSYFPFGEAYHFAFKIRAYDEPSFGRLYVSRQSIVSYLAAMPLYHYWVKGEEVVLTEEEEVEIANLMVEKPRNRGIENSKIRPNVIIILVESLESWPINLSFNSSPRGGWEGVFMPNLSKLVRDDNTMFCNHIISETKHGNSGDGQMTVLTGLLPISSGAACCLYDQNVYPSFVHNYDNAIIVNPAPNAWHQDKMSVNYGFNKVVEPTSSSPRGGREGVVDDEWVLNKMVENIQQVDTPFVMMGITLTSHVPFEYGKTHQVHSPAGMPDVMNYYLNTLHYTDACIGKLIDALHETGLDENTVLVITGDHNIFRDANFSKEMDEYAAKNGIDFKNGHTYTPLIVYSKQFITHNTLIEEEYYQMDIYPTIAQYAGTDLWKGVGVAIDESKSLRVEESKSRSISETKAYELSDKIIRSNYFKKFRR